MREKYSTSSSYFFCKSSPKFCSSNERESALTEIARSDIKGERVIFHGNDKLSRPIVVKHVALKNKPDISGTRISMVVLENIRSAVKIKVEGTSAPRQTLEKVREESGALNRSLK